MAEAISSLVVNFARQARKALGEVGVLPEVRPQIPLKDISSSTVAGVIARDIGNISRAGREQGASFSADTVVKNMGHVSLSVGARVREVFPRELAATHRALRDLVESEALSGAERQVDDGRVEKKFSVINRERLKQIAAGTFELK
ncbi:hypothetical protein ISS85_02780 [Candidatus Microgenomates bacterium]|nr:hypothetical protein [Candidatus Microgenomates bacterium]